MSLKIKRVLFFVLTILSYLLIVGGLGFVVMKLAPDQRNPVYVAGLGIVFSVILAWIIRKLADHAQIKLYPVSGTSRFGPLYGTLVGLGASILCALAYARLTQNSIHMPPFQAALSTSWILSIFPSLTEEVVFRFGIVNAAAFLGGPWVALLAGSLPFGLMHLIGNVFGGNLELLQTLGVSFGGLLLSLVYLKWGLPAAIMTHAVWNSLSIPWLKGMYLDPRTDMASFEGAWTTCVVLMVLCAALIVSLPKELLQRTTK